MSDDHLHFNGVNGATGSYLITSTRQDLARQIQGPRVLTTRGLMPGVMPEDLASSGWGVIFTEGADPAIEEALQPLLEHRKAVAQRDDQRFYRLFKSADGCWPGESPAKFLARQGAGPGPVDPKKVPFYLLIVGGPEEIPFDFQYQLGVQYAVGRVAFESAEDYAQYARNVVEAETDPVARPRRAALFGVQNPDDDATRYSTKYLLKPVLASLTDDRKTWQIDSRLGAAATKAQLGRFLGGDDRPTLLFTASHGMGFPRDDPRQRPHSGALLCQDWPGPKAWTGRVPTSHYFNAEDVGDDADLRGMVTFHFACFGVGVPKLSSFGHKVPGSPRIKATRPFVSRLPQRLLSHPRGALAVIGHVDLAWAFSFYWNGAGQQPQPFEAALKCLMDGQRVGHAMTFFGERYGQLSAYLTAALERHRGDKPAEGKSVAPLVPDDETLDLWTATNDARSYAILGDPAVRLKVETRA